MNPKYSRIWLGAFILLVFAAGLATGIVVARRPFGAEPMRFGLDMPGRRFAGPPPARMLARMARDLQLTDEQRRRIEQVLSERRGRLESFHERVRADFEREQQELRAAIRDVLTDEQKARFDELFPGGVGRFRRRGPPWRQ